MPANNENFIVKLFYLLKSHGLKPVGYNSSGDKTVPKDADVILFSIPKSNESDSSDDTGRINLSVTIDDTGVVKLYYDGEVTESPMWSQVRNHIKNFAIHRQLDWELDDQSELEYDMAKRKEMKKEKIQEGYHAMGKKMSYSDSVPTVKIVLQHNKVMEEGDKRYKYVDRIYLENVDGERILAPTCRPSVAKIYARLLAEGDKPYGERWGHISSLVEEYTKLSGFVKATKNRVFNESAQKLIENTVTHFMGLQETLNKLMTHRGYNSYFDSWSPVLTESETEQTMDLSEMFHDSSIDTRIEAALPIIQKINRGLIESTELAEITTLEAWGQDIIDEAIFGESEEMEKYILYIDGKRATHYENKADAERDAEHLRKRGAKVEVKHEMYSEPKSKSAIGEDLLSPKEVDEGELDRVNRARKDTKPTVPTTYMILSGGQWHMARNEQEVRKIISKDPTAEVHVGGKDGKIIKFNEDKKVVDEEILSLKKLSGI